MLKKLFLALVVTVLTVSVAVDMKSNLVLVADDDGGGGGDGGDPRAGGDGGGPRASS